MNNYCDWQKGVVNRNFYILSELRKKKVFSKILLVDFFSVQEKKMIYGKRHLFDYALKYPIHQIKEIENDKLFVYTGVGAVTSHEKDYKRLIKFLEGRGFTKTNTIIWSYNPLLTKNFDIPHTKIVFDTVDNWAEHSRYKRIKNLLYKNYTIIKEKSDYIFVVSKGLLDLFDNRENVTWVPNGIDLSIFHNIKSKILLNNSGKPVVGYLGTIQNRVNFELLDFIIDKHQNKHFVFIGPIWSDVKNAVGRLQSDYKNVEFLGRVNYQTAPQYIAQFDVAIIPHKIDKFIDSTNPMKMYEYLAMGKPVVTTSGSGTEMFKDLMYIEDDYYSFSQSINKALNENDPRLNEIRKNAVIQHTWSNRVDVMLKCVIL